VIPVYSEQYGIIAQCDHLIYKGRCIKNVILIAFMNARIGT